MPTIYRISRPGSDEIRDIGSVEAIEPVVRASEPGRYHVDEIGVGHLPSGHTSRRGGTAIKRPDGAVVIEPDP